MVTEMDKLRRAKEYLEKLAEGVDPFTGETLAHDTVLNNVRLSRCFFYTAGVLGRVIRNGGRIGGASGGKKPFIITDEEIARVSVSDKPVPVSVFVKAVNDAVLDPERKTLSAVKITGWLEKKGLLKTVETEPGKRRKVLTEKSAAAGMSSETRQGAGGTYEIMLYDKKAQRFLLDNLKNMTEE